MKKQGANLILFIAAFVLISSSNYLSVPLITVSECAGKV